MKKSNKRFYLFVAIAFVIWLIPFFIRLLLFGTDFSIETDKLHEKGISNNKVIEELVNSLDEDNKSKAFILIFKNNIIGCIINIVGGVLLGIGTIMNLTVNGFASSDVLVYSYNRGLSVREILNVTLPHSFELIGFWISGAMGLNIAWRIILFMQNKKDIDFKFYKEVAIQFLGVFIIILLAAYVEAYVTILNI